jgi:hypothetical protein
MGNQVQDPSMSTLEFHRSLNEIALLSGDGSIVGTFKAANNVDSHSRGPWPDGQYDFDHHGTHPDDAPDSPYGSDAIFIFDVPDREGMGVHSGRESVPDGLGRRGFLHCTMGCVRTTDDAMAQLVTTHSTDPITAITIAD